MYDLPPNDFLPLIVYLYKLVFIITDDIVVTTIWFKTTLLLFYHSIIFTGSVN